MNTVGWLKGLPRGSPEKIVGSWRKLGLPYCRRCGQRRPDRPAAALARIGAGSGGRLGRLACAGPVDDQADPADALGQAREITAAAAPLLGRRAGEVRYRLVPPTM